MVMPGEPQMNRRHIFTISGLPMNTMVTAEIGAQVADRAIASEDVPVVLVVEHGHPIPGWKNRGTFLNADEGVNINIVAEQMVPPRVLASFPYQFGGISTVDDVPEAEPELTEEGTPAPEPTAEDDPHDSSFLGEEPNQSASDDSPSG